MNKEIVLDHVSYLYDQKEVLNKLSLCVCKGENIGIIGESGGGKSTLLKIISGLYRVSEGTVMVAGESEPEAIRRNVAMVMQTNMLFPVSIRDNITCGHAMDEKIVDNACKAAQLTDWIHTLPDGIDTYVGERGSKVSGGQAQRIAIARAIAKGADIILLDEPTSALDSNTEEMLMEAFNQLTLGKTVIHVSHRKSALEGCHRIYRLVHGGLELC